MKRYLPALMFAVVLTGCDTTTSDDAGLACDHFRNVAADVRSGQLTPAETRAKLIEVRDDAIIGSPSMQSASRAMVAAITSDDFDALKTAVDDMDSACSAEGH